MVSDSCYKLRLVIAIFPWIFHSGFVMLTPFIGAVSRQSIQNNRIILQGTHCFDKLQKARDSALRVVNV